MNYKLMDSKTGERAAFDDRHQACVALTEWIQKQRHAGESVVKQPNGQWSDSRVTIWICDSNDDIVELDLDEPTGPL